MLNENIKPIKPGDAVKELKDSLRLTNHQLAVKLGINESSVRAVIKGRVGLTNKMAQKLADLKVEGKDYNYWINLRDGYSNSNGAEAVNEMNSEDD